MSRSPPLILFSKNKISVSFCSFFLVSWSADRAINATSITAEPLIILSQPPFSPGICSVVSVAVDAVSWACSVVSGSVVSGKAGSIVSAGWGSVSLVVLD